MTPAIIISSAALDSCEAIATARSIKGDEMTIRFHVLTADGAITGDVRGRLDAALEEGARVCSELLDLPEIDVVVRNSPDSVIPRIGTNGWCADVHTVDLIIDVEHPNLKENFLPAVRAVLAHELHHCARARLGRLNFNPTYGECLVDEGLACCFEEEIGSPTPFYAVECSGEELRQFAEKAKSQLNKERRDFGPQWNDWMFGRWPSDPEFPYQCGYSTGYAIVRTWLAATRNTASSAVGVNAGEVIKAWSDGSMQPFD